jgi:hypothetical protein
MRGLIAVLLLLSVTAGAPPPAPPLLERFAVAATPVPLDANDPARDRTGRLRYLGGLELTSGDRRFGGLSGLRWWNGALLAVTDGGNWVRLDVNETGDRLTGIAAAQVGMIRGPERAALRGRAHVDAEALDADATGLAVAFERDHRIWRYARLDGPPWAEDFPDTGWLESLPRNGGVEAMARFGTVWQAYIAERAPTALLAAKSGTMRTSARVPLTLPDDFRATDAEALDATRMLLLSRRHGLTLDDAVTVSIVDVDAKRLALGVPRPIATLTAPMTLDNMEGLAIRRDGNRAFIYLVSDDNFSPLQRTLLMKFEILP